MYIPTLPFISLLEIPFIAPKRVCKQTFILNDVIYLISVLLIVPAKIKKETETIREIWEIGTVLSTRLCFKLLTYFPYQP